MELGISGQVALVTGASKGIGAATARLLAAEGARVVLVARGRAVLDALAAELPGAIAMPADLAQTDSADAVVRATLAACGRIDILVNSAGAAQGGLFWEIPDSVWEDAINLKLMANLRMLRAVLPGMVAQRSGRVVTVVGNTGRQPAPRLLPGSAANAALLAITKGVADEVAGSGVLVNAVNPGPTRTERWSTLMTNLAAAAGKTVDEVEAGYTAQIPLGRLGEAEEMARLIVFLCSPAAANITGTSLTADGGWTRALA